ncbi:uncharacterized protein LOC135342254 isoform X2 [Halichondria panicea]
MAEVPLKERIFYSRTKKAATVCEVNSKNRPPSYKHWDLKTVSTACSAIRNGTLSQRRAAEEYGIPRSTLGDYYRGSTLPGAKSGPNKYLSDAEEAELTRFLIRCASVGFPKTRSNVIAIVQRVCDRKGVKVTVTHGWYESFTKRHSELVLRIPAKLSVARAKATDGVSVQTGRKKTAPDDQAPVVVIDPESPVKSSGESAARNVKSTPFSTRAGDSKAYKVHFQVSNESLLDDSETNPCLKDWVSDLGLSLYEKQALQRNAWLSANHISAANMLLRREFPHQNGLQDTMYLLENLQWRSSAHEFVQIIHVGGFHWACLSNKLSSDASKIQLYDSLHIEPGPTIIEQSCTILHCMKDRFTIQVVNVQLQYTGDSCGLFAIAMAYDLCSGRNPLKISYDESMMRVHLERCFNNRELSRFPRAAKKRDCPKTIVAKTQVPVYCSCRYSDVEVTSRFGDMASCDSCSKWYHQDCENIPNAVFNDTQKTWFCMSCSQ